jgi:hypothetical protein
MADRGLVAALEPLEGVASPLVGRLRDLRDLRRRD